MMHRTVFGTLSGYWRWLSRSARLAFRCMDTSGTNLRWGAGHSPLAHVTAATCSLGTVAVASSRFADHFTLASAVLRNHPQLPMSSLVFLLRLILFSMSSVSSSHTKTPK